MTARPATTRTPDPATAAQRRRRVTAGLAELDIWLADQVRTGLARIDGSTGAFEAMAARMVDAQAPAVAARLRALAYGDRAAADRPRRMLAELAALHLLVTAHRDLDDLPEAQSATVRTHIGYPMPTASVRERPAVRDHWMTLGIRVSAEDRLHTRRTWLRGRRTHQWALLVEHSFGDDPAFPATAPPPGRMVDAEVHYYPGAPRLRALWGVRHGAEEPFTTLPAAAPTRASVPDSGHARPGRGPGPDSGRGADIRDANGRGPDLRGARDPEVENGCDPDLEGDGDCAAAAAAYASALTADPWLRSWPVLLREVIPAVDGGRQVLVDRAGAALPMTGLEQPWRMLGTAGGHPVTVVGEWTADGLVPISLLAQGEIVDVREPDALADPTRAADAPDMLTPSPPDDLTTTALLGTAHRSLDSQRLPPPVAELVAELSGDPPRVLLAAAALREAYDRAARTPETATPPAPAPDDPRRLLPGPAAVRLSDMLRVRSPFLPEWFEAALPHDYRAPDALCARLLETARADPALRDPLLRLAGARGRWLAARHPTWHELFADASPGHGAMPPATGRTTSDTWLSGPPAHRRDRLAGLRRRDPETARRVLEQAWPEEPDPGRAELLAVLADGLDSGDEPLLEAALDDRRSDVRRTAAGLLAVLPDSAFAGRMRARAARWLRIEHTGDVVAVHVDIPEDLDDTARRDGITDRTVEFSYRWNGVPDYAAGRLRQLVAATPLNHWRASAGEPRAALRARVPDRYRQPLLDGLLDATLHQRDPAWAAALFANGVPSDTALLRRRELFALMPCQARVAHLRRLDSAWLSELEALLPAMEHPWPQELAQHVILLLLERARICEQNQGAHGTGPAAHRSLLTAAATHLPVDATGLVGVAAGRCADPTWQRAFDRLADDLTHRSKMLEELQQ
ncbi:SWIM zinc finger family protein [Nocardia higoensis]|uniref:SWIM zinc finger family protein n=1 Tax=Nocardia higoensis TaxID=228599 RepID=A0ABS0DET8_9NOCA|nr:DUF5691 domain-containing protein [Nocardia higoensis]MBF6355198.1 SWIM zinc finger family protein [Nocardia higoensis]